MPTLTAAAREGEAERYAGPPGWEDGPDYGSIHGEPPRPMDSTELLGRQAGQGSCRMQGTYPCTQALEYRGPCPQLQICPNLGTCLFLLQPSDPNIPKHCHLQFSKQQQITEHILNTDCALLARLAITLRAQCKMKMQGSNFKMKTSEH